MIRRRTGDDPSYDRGVRWLLVLAVGGCGFSPATANLPITDGSIHDVATDVIVDGSPIPITYVQGNVATSAGTNVVTLAASFAGPQTAGNLDILVISMYANANPVVSVVDLDGNTYASLGFSSRNTLAQAAYYAPNIHGGSANVVTVTFGAGGVSQPELRIAEYSGIAADPYETSNIATGTSATSDSGPITTLYPHDLIVGANTVSQLTTGPGSLFTKRVIIQGDLLEDREVFAAGVYHATAPINTDADWNMLVAAFEGAR